MSAYIDPLSNDCFCHCNSRIRFRSDEGEEIAQLVCDMEERVLKDPFFTEIREKYEVSLVKERLNATRGKDTAEILAIAIAIKRPQNSVQKIADLAGVDQRTPYRWLTFFEIFPRLQGQRRAEFEDRVPGGERVGLRWRCIDTCRGREKADGPMRTASVFSDAALPRFFAVGLQCSHP